MNAVGVSCQRFQRPFPAKCPMQNLWDWPHHFMPALPKPERGSLQISLEIIQNLLDLLLDLGHVNPSTACQYRFSHSSLTPVSKGFNASNRGHGITLLFLFISILRRIWPGVGLLIIW